MPFHSTAPAQIGGGADDPRHLGWSPTQEGVFVSDVMIHLDNITKTFPGMERPAVENLTLEIPRGEIVMLVGPSGCGKTTTLKMINRLIEPTDGRLIVDGVDVTHTEAHELRRSIGYVIQQVGLFPHRTIAENIGTVPRLLDWDKSRIDARVAELLDLVELEPDMLDRYPTELSGGQRQRVGVARALAADPPVLLMDEPFGAVDPIVRGRLQSELMALQAKVEKTIVFVTHDIDEAIRLGDRLVILNVGGVLEQEGRPADILRDPANPFVEEFLGGERGLKRLALLPIGDLGLDTGPMVEAGAPASEAHRAMEQYTLDWFGVVQGGRLLGWMWADELDGSAVPTSGLRPFRVLLNPRSTLREALDQVVTSHTQTAVVTDGDQYLGALDLSQIASQIVA